MSQRFPGWGRVAVLRTRPETVLEDYARLMELAGFREALPPDKETILKVNISWQTWYPACSTTPWQLEGVIRALLAAGYRDLIAAQNNTVVVDAYVGERNNKHLYVVQKYGLRNVHLYEPQYRWVRYEPRRPFLVLDQVYPEGVYIPEILIGRNIIQLPTVKCVHPDTRIPMADGTLARIEDLVEGELRAGAIPLLDEDGDVFISRNVPLWSLTPDGSTVSQQTLLFWRTPLNGHPLWRVRTKTGREVLVSAEHPFLTPHGWRKASELTSGDRIAIPRRIRVQGRPQPLPRLSATLKIDDVDIATIPFRPGRKFSVEFQKEVVRAYLSGETLEQIAARHGVRWQSLQSILRRYRVPMRRMKHWIRIPEQTSPDFWRWFGYFVAEGWVQPMRTTCRFWWTNGTPEIREDFFQLTQDLFGLEMRPRPRGYDCYVDSVQLREFFEKLGLSVPLDAANKRVPPLLFRCSDEEIAAFLSGYLDGDGSVGPRDGLHVATKSETLARDLQDLFLRLGVVAFIREHWARATNSSSPPQRYFLVSVYGDDLVVLARWVHFRTPQKQQRLQALVERRQNGKRPTNWDTIPVDREQFRMVRRGLGFTQVSTGRPAWVQNIESGATFPTRRVLKYFVDLFRQADVEGRYRNEIETMAFFASEDIAWDHVVSVETVRLDTPYLYDFTMPTYSNFVGNGLILSNTHVFTTITGAMKNAFGGLLGTKRHWTHSVIHETLVDLLMIQQDIHPGLFAVMDGTFAGDGPGPRAMRWHEKDVILASADQVAIDAISAHLQGFDPLSIPFIRIAHEMGLGVGDPRQIEIVGEDPEWVLSQNWGFVQEDTFASRGQKMIYHGPLKPFEKLLLRTPLVPWSYFASNFYHNVYWYPFVGRKRVEAALQTKWGRLFTEYGAEAGYEGVVMPGMEPRTVMTAALGLAFLAAGIVAGAWWLGRKRK
jgi:intein/homing endonuclease/uncharacterized protein (DUF362 family)